MDDMYKSVAHVQLTTVVCNTTAILERLSRICDPATQEAHSFIYENGGADAVMKVYNPFVLKLQHQARSISLIALFQNASLVEKVASLLGEKATYSMKSILNTGLDMLLRRHAYVLCHRPY